VSADPLRRFFRNAPLSGAENGDPAPAPTNDTPEPEIPEPIPFVSSPRQPSPEPPSVAPVWVGPCLRIAGEAANPSLILQQRGGERTALSYGYLSAVQFKPEEGVMLQFVGHAVSITGRRLAEVFEAIASHRALTIAEAPGNFDTDPKSPFVEAIVVLSTQER